MTAPLTPKARALVAAARSGMDATPADLDRVWARIGLGIAAAGATSIAGGAASAAVAPASAAPTGLAAPGAGTAALAPTSGVAPTAASTVASAATGTGMSGALKIGLVLLVTGAAGLGGGALYSVFRGEAAGVADRAVSTPRLPAAAPAVEAPAPTEPIAPVAPALEAPAPTEPDRAASLESPAAEPPDFVFAPEAVERGEPRRRRPPRPPPDPARPAAADVPAGPSLSQELTLVRRARAALRLGMPDRALQLLAQHARRFPAAVLAQEAAVVRIEAVCALGDAARARALTEAFGRSWPESPLGARVHKMCGAAGTPR